MPKTQLPRHWEYLEAVLTHMAFSPLAFNSFFFRMWHSTRSSSCSWSTRRQTRRKKSQSWPLPPDHIPSQRQQFSRLFSRKSSLAVSQCHHSHFQNPGYISLSEGFKIIPIQEHPSCFNYLPVVQRLFKPLSFSLNVQKKLKGCTSVLELSSPPKIWHLMTMHYIKYRKSD